TLAPGRLLSSGRGASALDLRLPLPDGPARRSAGRAALPVAQSAADHRLRGAAGTRLCAGLDLLAGHLADRIAALQPAGIDRSIRSRPALVRAVHGAALSA